MPPLATPRAAPHPDAPMSKPVSEKRPMAPKAMRPKAPPVPSPVRAATPALVVEELAVEEAEHLAKSVHAIGVGTVLDGKYELTGVLGEGGMGSVYVAQNLALDVPVAIKVIRADIESKERGQLADRLLHEARAAARLGDPAILRVFDLGTTADGQPYLVMELLEGEDLASVMDQRGELDPVEAVQLLLPIAHALAAAHEKNIVHRDVKPENIFLARTATGEVQPKLIDFGVAKLEQKAAARLTVVGTLMGSPGYMSPQQARGEEVDDKADIWSLCVVLYELLSGALPFDGPNYNALIRSTIENEPKPLESYGVGDPALSAIIARGMSKSWTGRWPSMRALGEALAGWLVGRGHTDDVCGSSLAPGARAARQMPLSRTRSSFPRRGRRRRKRLPRPTPHPGRASAGPCRRCRAAAGRKQRCQAALAVP